MKIKLRDCKYLNVDTGTWRKGYAVIRQSKDCFHVSALLSADGILVLRVPDQRHIKFPGKFRELSAGKVAIVLNGLDVAVDGHPSKKFREGGARVVKHIRAKLLSGQLDADRPKFPKCKDTGVLRGAQDIRANGEYWGYYTAKCDCGAKPEGER